MEVSRALRYLKNLLGKAIEIILLLAFIIIAYTCLLYFAKYLWFLFSATDVGQTYAKIYEESYRLTNDILHRNFISLAVNLTLTSFVICLMVAAIYKFLHIIRYCYSDRGLPGRFLLAGLPLSFIVAFYLNYIGDFIPLDTALSVALVPTLCLFTACFRLAEEFVPGLADIIGVFAGHQKDIRNQAKITIKKQDAKQKATVLQIALQDLWELLTAYMTVIIIFALLIGTLFVLPKIHPFPQTEVIPEKQPAVNEEIQETKLASMRQELKPDDRFVAYPGRIVLDKKTNLMWAAEESETLNWYDAQKYCRKFRGGGRQDWRMPTIAELRSLYDASLQPGCACVTDLIEMYNGPNCWEWSSESKDSDAAIFAFNLNGKQWLEKSNDSSVHIRPVRLNK